MQLSADMYLTTQLSQISSRYNALVNASKVMKAFYFHIIFFSTCLSGTSLTLLKVCVYFCACESYSNMLTFSSTFSLLSLVRRSSIF